MEIKTVFFRSDDALEISYVKDLQIVVSSSEIARQVPPWMHYTSHFHLQACICKTLNSTDAIKDVTLKRLNLKRKYGKHCKWRMRDLPCMTRSVPSLPRKYLLGSVLKRQGAPRKLQGDCVDAARSLEGFILNCPTKCPTYTLTGGMLM